MLEFLIITLIVLACVPFIPWSRFGKKKSLLDEPLQPFTTQTSSIETPDAPKRSIYR